MIQLQNPGDAILAAYEVQELAWWQASPQEAPPPQLMVENAQSGRYYVVQIQNLIKNWADGWNNSEEKKSYSTQDM